MFRCLAEVKHREDDWVARCQSRVIKALVLTVNCASYLTNSQEITYKIKKIKECAFSITVSYLLVYVYIQTM